MIDSSKLNPVEWIKELIEAINKLPIGILLSIAVLLTVVIIAPSKYITKFYLTDFMPYISLFDLFAIILVCGKTIQKTINYIQEKASEQKMIKSLTALSPKEKTILKTLVTNSDKKIPTDSFEQTTINLLKDAVIIKTSGTKVIDETTFKNVYTIHNKAWPVVKKYFK